MKELLLQSPMTVSLALGGFGLLVALVLIRNILRADCGNARMQEIAIAIQEGAAAYLHRQVITISIIASLIFALVWHFRNMQTAIGFLIGAICSLIAGYIGMTIAVRANVRTTQAATQSIHSALKVSFNGGAITGLLVVGLALLSVGLFYKTILNQSGDVKVALDALVGLALGSSLISVFARLGGGIYTKAADVGADLVGKIESKLEEDDPRNPATIADNVGDNVGDCAGMAADVFETYAVSLIGAILIGFLTVQNSPEALTFPFLISGISIIGVVLGIVFINVFKAKPAALLTGGVLISGLLSAALFWPVTHYLFPNGIIINGSVKSPTSLYCAALVGIVMTYIVVLVTNYYTSTQYSPVRRIAHSSETGHATNIITGLSVGQHATALPVAFIGIAIFLSYHFAGLYGISIAVVSMLSLAGIIISLDAFGPITDNAGGIAVMSSLPKEIRVVTDELDAVGNTMKAVTKGYAIASAGLAALVLFGSYVEELKAVLASNTHLIEMLQFSLKEPRVIIGLFIGGLLPYMFTAYSMDAVSNAAGSVVREVRRQIGAKPGILTGEDKPEYGTCVDIVTKAALRQMILPALLPLIFVIGVAAIPALGPVVLGGVLVGTIVTGLFLGISMTSSGGAWDNAKKYIELGNYGGKHSPAHSASVTGDTVGDPYKDTAGPAVNPMIKVVNIVAILIIPIFFK